MNNNSLTKTTILVGLLLAAFMTVASSAHAMDYRALDTTVYVAEEVGLATRVYVPEADGSYPTILLRTPYGSENKAWLAQYLAPHGYAVVVQDVRGKNGSGGDFFPFAYEKADGMATLDWVLKQPFCNGDVGLWGVSHLGFAANEIASTGYPAVKAVFNLSGWSELEPFIAHGGSFHLMAHLPWFVMFKGGQNPPVRLFVMGDNEWRNFETWPPKAVETQAWYVDCAEMANGSVGTGTLAATRTELE